MNKNEPAATETLAVWRKFLKPFGVSHMAEQIRDKRRKALIPTVPRVPYLKRFAKVKKYNANWLAPAKRASVYANRRLKNWREAKPCDTVVDKGSYLAINAGRYKGKFNRIIWNYVPLYTSYYVLSQSKLGLVYIRGFRGEIKKTFIRAPKGMRFGRDSLGLKVVRMSDGMDLHLSGVDLERAAFAGFVRSGMAAKYRAAQANKKQQKQLAVDKVEADRIAAIVDQGLTSCRVTLEDSRRAGNCIEGSLRFAEIKLGVTREEIIAGQWLTGVPANRLLATGDTRAKAAVKMAYQRDTTISI